MHTMAPTRAAELPKCTVHMEPGPAAATEARGPGRGAIWARNAPAVNDATILLVGELATRTLRRTAGETAKSGIPCARIQLRADARDMPACLPVLADAELPGGARDPGHACRGTAGSGYRSMAGPSGELGKVPGNSVKLRSAGEPE